MVVVANSPISLPISSRNCSLRQLVAREAHQRELLGQQIVLGEIVERRDEFALGQIARRAKDHHHARIAGTSGAENSLRSDVFCQLHSSPFSSILPSRAREQADFELCQRFRHRRLKRGQSTLHVVQMDSQRPPFAIGQNLEISASLRGFHHAERELLPRYRQDRLCRCRLPAGTRRYSGRLCRPARSSARSADQIPGTSPPFSCRARSSGCSSASSRAAWFISTYPSSAK